MRKELPFPVGESAQPYMSYFTTLRTQNFQVELLGEEQYQVRESIISPEELNPACERSFTSFILGYEVLRQSQIPHVLEEFNNSIFEGNGKVSISRNLFKTKYSPEMQLRTGSAFEVASFNAAMLEWESPSNGKGEVQFNTMGMGIVDARHIGYFFLQSPNACIAPGVIFDKVCEKSQSYAYIRGPVADKKAMQFPIIQNNAITSTAFFEHLRIWTQNSCAETINSRIRMNALESILPDGVSSDLNQLPLRLFPQRKDLEVVA